MENHPDLKANENVLHLQESLSSLEEEIQMARRYYNATARDLNIAIQSVLQTLLPSVTALKTLTSLNWRMLQKLLCHKFLEWEWA